MICGASGSGKSGLALQLMAHGADLVADDRTLLTRQGAQVIADVPDTIRNRIEARGVGILSAPAVGPLPVALVIDLDTTETSRLPPRREIALLGVPIRLLRNVKMPHFPAAILKYLACGRIA